MDGKQSAKAKVVIGQAVLPIEGNGSAVAIETGAPDTASTNAILAANSAIKTGFGASPVFFAVDELGGKYAKSGGTTAETNTETLDLSVDTTKIGTLGKLGVGFFDPITVGAGFTSLTFTLTADGSTVVSQTFTSLAAANAFFNDRYFSLGTLGAGALTASTLTLVATLTITTDAANSGYYFNAIIGDPPAASGSAAAGQRFAQAMAGLGAKSGGSLPMGNESFTANSSMLAIGRNLAAA